MGDGQYENDDADENDSWSLRVDPEWSMIHDSNSSDECWNSRTMMSCALSTRKLTSDGY